jgi:hypothetical protein
MQPEPPVNDGWQEIVHQYVAHHQVWPTMSLPLPPPPMPKNPNAQVDHVVSPVQYCHASKRIKTDVPKPGLDKGKINEKEWPLPPSHPKIPPNLCPLIFVLNTIAPMSSARSTLKVLINLRLQQKDQKRASMKRGQMPLIVNMGFNVD